MLSAVPFAYCTGMSTQIELTESHFFSWCSPRRKPSVELVKLTSNSVALPLASDVSSSSHWHVQVVPESVVSSTMPSSPTAQPWLSSRKKMRRS
jgi:hypothetical protein